MLKNGFSKLKQTTVLQSKERMVNNVFTQGIAHFLKGAYFEVLFSVRAIFSSIRLIATVLSAASTRILLKSRGPCLGNLTSDFDDKF